MPTTFDDDFLPGHLLSAVEINKIKNNTVVQVDTVAELSSVGVDVNVAYVVEDKSVYKRDAADASGWMKLSTSKELTDGLDGKQDNSMIDADVPANLVGLPTSGQPLAFYGTDRPDGLGDGPLITAPAGSTYTYVGPDSRKEPILGAMIWFQFSSSGKAWVVQYGATPAVSNPASPNAAMRWEAMALRVGGQSIQARFYGGQTWHEMDSVDHCYNKTQIASQGTTQMMIREGGTTVAGLWKYSSTGITLEPVTASTSTHYAIGAHNFAIDCSASATWPTEKPAGANIWGSPEHIESCADYIRLVEGDSDHPDHEQLQQLRDELAALTGTKPKMV